MSIHAHPDDQEFTVAGTLAKWARTGSEIVSVCITSGGAGSNKYTPLDMTRHALVAIREDEQREACRILGYELTMVSNAGHSVDLSGPVMARALCHVDNAYWLPDVSLQAALSRSLSEQLPDFLREERNHRVQQSQ